MGFFKSLLYLVPIRLGCERQIDPDHLGDRIYSNRRNPNSGVVFIGDAIENTKDELFALTRRTPADGYLIRDSDGTTTTQIARVREPGRNR